MTAAGAPPFPTAIRQDWSDADELRLRASLLAFFELPWLGPIADSEVADQLLQDCDRISGPDGVRHWIVPDSLRRDVLRVAGIAHARAAWQALAHRPDTAEQSVIDRCVGHGQQVSVDIASEREVTAVRTVARWLNVLDVPLPSEWELGARAGREAIFGPLRKLAGAHFTGRAAMLARLANDLRYDPAITLIYGIGGIGKSTIAAQHVLNAVDIGALTCYLTFDQGSIDPNQPASILAATCRQFAVQLDQEASGAVTALAERAVDNQRYGGRRRESAGRDLNILGDLVTSVLRDLDARLDGQRCLLVIDALEEAQRRGESAVLSLLGFLGTVNRTLRATQVLLLGRAPLESAAQQEIAQVHLEGLEFTEATSLLEALLTDLGVQPDPPIDIRAAIEQIGTSPLCVHLAAGILAKAPQDQALRDLALTRGAIEGELYRRLLGHIADPDVRKLAHPGLTLRRVTPDLIRYVLAGPCHLRVPDDETARRLFEGLAAEAMLVERVPGAAEVVHRADIRALMLRGLSEDAADVITAIHRAAVRHYADLEQPSDRVEEIYHRLMLSEPVETLDQRWQDHVISGLLPSMDEMPATSKAYLAQRAGVIDVSDRDLITAQRTTQRELVIRRVQRFVAAGQVGEARAELQRHQDETQDSSPDLSALWVEVLELQGDLDAALERAEAERGRAGKRGSNQDLFAFTLHSVRLLERTGRPAVAAQELDGALVLVRQLPDSEAYRLTRLRLLAAILGLVRRAGETASDALADEAITCYDHTSPRAVTSTPGLLRDLAAELGARFPRILKAALVTLGLHADTDQLAGTLTRWDGQESRAEGVTSGRLASLARVERSATGDYDWQGWASGISPGRLGKRLTELSSGAGTFPESVAADLAGFYQRESDVALIGFESVTDYEFIGRDLDISHIERLIDSAGGNELLIHGMAGVGKTSLLSQLSSFWQQTGVVDRVFRFDHLRSASGDADEIIRRIGSVVLAATQRADDSVSDSERQVLVTETLRATRHVVVIDDLDWMLRGMGLAARQKLATVLSQLRSGRTRVLLGARDPAAVSVLGVTDLVTYPLGGLDQRSASVLAERILRRHNHAFHLDDPAEQRRLDDLLAILAGSPLALNLLLPAAATTPLAEILASLDTGDSRADPAGKARSVSKTSYDLLDQAAQRALVLLSPFNRVIDAEGALDAYRDHLARHEDVLESDPVDFRSALDQAVAVGLAAAHPRLQGHIQLHPLLTYFLRGQLRAQPQTRAALDNSHYALYTDLGPALDNLLRSGDPQRRAVGEALIEAEYLNINAALRYAARTGERITPLVGVLDNYLNRKQSAEGRRRLWDEIIGVLESAGRQPAEQELAYLYSVAGNAAAEMHDAHAARRYIEEALRLRQAVGDRRGVAVSYHDLGLLQQQVGDLDGAWRSYSQALDIFTALGEQRSAALVYERLGTVAYERGRYEEAEAAYRQALDLFAQRGDRLELGGVLFNLGRLEADQERLDEAEASYRQALDIFLESGQQSRVRSAYIRLGMLAHQQERYTAAEAAYQDALEITLALGDRGGLGNIYYNLGRLTADEGRLDEAEASYRQALDIFLETSDRPSAGAVYWNLGWLAHQQQRYDDAKAAYRQALDIAVSLADQPQVARIHMRLGELSLSQRRYAEAEISFQQARDVSLNLSDWRGRSSAGTMIGISQAGLGRHQDATTALLRAAVIWRKDAGQWADIDLEWLRRERELVDSSFFRQQVSATIPVDLLHDFYAAMDAAEPK